MTTDRLRASNALGFLVIALLFLTLGSFAWALRSTQITTSQFLFDRCVSAQKTNAIANRWRNEEIVRYQEFIEQEKKNKFIDDDLRSQRVRAWTALIAAAQKVNDVTVPVDCGRLKFNG